MSAERSAASGDETGGLPVAKRAVAAAPGITSGPPVSSAASEAEYERRMTCPRCGQYGDGCNCDAATEHVHEWEPVGMTKERRLVSDGRRDWYVTLTLAVRSCKCGAIRRTEVSRV